MKNPNKRNQLTSGLSLYMGMVHSYFISYKQVHEFNFVTVP